MEIKKLLRVMLVAAGVMAMLVAPAADAVAAEPAPNPAPQLPVQHSRTRPAKKKAKTAAPATQAGGEKKATQGKNVKTNAKANKEGSKRKAPAAAAVSDRYRAFKINIPYAAAVIQNLAFEWQTGKKMTVDIPVMWSFSDLTDRHGVRTIAVQPEARWWPGANPGNGHFLGAHLSAAWFNVRWNDTRYQADSLPLLGAGISYGYRLPFNANWGAEFNLGVGYAYMEYDRFFNIDNGAKIDRRSRNYFGITRVGVSLVYRF